MKKLVVVLIALAVMIPFGSAGAQTNDVFAWGAVGNGNGPLTFNGLSPTATELTGASAIQASNSNTFVIESGSEYATGYGTAGELGNGAKDSSFITPAKVDFPTGTTVTALGDAEDAGYAADSGGDAWSWGENQSGDLCLGSETANKDTPQNITGMPSVKAVAGGAEHVSWLTSAGTVYSCGQNDEGQLGDGSFTKSTTPVEVPGLSGVVAISAGWGNVAALTSSGALYTWGFNGQGAVGNGSLTDADTPQPISGTFSSVYVGGSTGANSHMIAITTSGAIEVWGDNSQGELGLGYTSNHVTSPTVMTPPTDVTFVKVMAGGQESGAVDSSGNVWMWGGNNNGEIGNGTSGSTKVLTPVEVDSGRSVLSGTASNVADY